MSISVVWRARVLRLLSCALNEMVVTLSVLLWVFHVAASFPHEAYAVDFEPPNEFTNSDSDMSYLLPLLRQSACQPRETLVKVWHEFPEEMHHTISPCFVPVQRCGGHCSDEATVCVPVKNYTVLVQVQRAGDPNVFIELPFVQHSRCSCRSRKSLSATFVHF